MGTHPDEPVYVGVGGMHRLPRRILAEAQDHAQSRLEVRAGVRVAAVSRDKANGGNGKWKLLGTTGTAAFHDTKE